MKGSAAKIKANRANARYSTGPKTAAGRQRSARNALRHGLNIPVDADPVRAKAIATLTRAIAGPDASAEIDALARPVAEAQVDLLRIREARCRLLSGRWCNLPGESGPPQRSTASAHGGGDGGDHSTVGLGLLKEPMRATSPHTLRRLALALQQDSRQLLALDRYERRALSRRKFAMRDLDDARRGAIKIRPARPNPTD